MGNLAGLARATCAGNRQGLAWAWATKPARSTNGEGNLTALAMEWHVGNAARV